MLIEQAASCSIHLQYQGLSPESAVTRYLLLAGLLTRSVFTAFPPNWAVAEDGNNFTGAYSYGDSPGFSPGSLLMTSAFAGLSTKMRCKVIRPALNRRSCYSRSVENGGKGQQATVCRWTWRRSTTAWRIARVHCSVCLHWLGQLVIKVSGAPRALALPIAAPAVYG